MQKKPLSRYYWRTEGQGPRHLFTVLHSAYSARTAIPATIGAEWLGLVTFSFPSVEISNTETCIHVRTHVDSAFGQTPTNVR